METKTEKTSASKFVKRFFLQVSAVLALLAIFVLVIDPFFHYHEPIAPLKKVVTKPEYQGIGTVRNFVYDSIIAGSSVAENYNNKWFDEKFGCTSIKAIKKSATTADLMYYLEEAYEQKELAYVFYSMDTSALLSDASKNFVDDSMPLYLYNDFLIDDVKYVWNKDVIFEHAPYMVSVSILEDYDEGTSYNWAQYKTFSATDTLSRYNRLEQITPMKSITDYETNIQGNVALLEQIVGEHPDTEFIFLMPPYSMLWWDNAYRDGTLEASLYAIETVADTLLAYENVEIYCYQIEESIVMNLDYYMDNVHFSADINQWMVEQLGQPTYQVTQENLQEIMLNLRVMAQESVAQTDVHKPLLERGTSEQ